MPDDDFTMPLDEIARLRAMSQRDDQLGRIAAWMLALQGAPEDRIDDPDRPVDPDRADTAADRGGRARVRAAQRAW